MAEDQAIKRLDIMFESDATLLHRQLGRPAAIIPSTAWSQNDDNGNIEYCSVV